MLYSVRWCQMETAGKSTSNVTRKKNLADLALPLASGTWNWWTRISFCRLDSDSTRWSSSLLGATSSQRFRDATFSPHVLSTMLRSIVFTGGMANEDSLQPLAHLGYPPAASEASKWLTRQCRHMVWLHSRVTGSSSTSKQITQLTSASRGFSPSSSPLADSTNVGTSSMMPFGLSITSSNSTFLVLFASTSSCCNFCCKPGGDSSLESILCLTG
mmetsp:Transcript_53231/g.88372  ORF Transcript_53231/g.88372 Transcript_53231/m.88372 type:complete len:215 (-) Transcript_53231:21-665(-)